MYTHLHKKINDLVDFRRSSENPEENHSEYWAESVKKDVNSDIEEEKELGVEKAPREAFFRFFVYHSSCSMLCIRYRSACILIHARSSIIIIIIIMVVEMLCGIRANCVLTGGGVYKRL